MPYILAQSSKAPAWLYPLPEETAGTEARLADDEGGRYEPNVTAVAASCVALVANCKASPIEFEELLQAPSASANTEVAATRPKNPTIATPLFSLLRTAAVIGVNGFKKSGVS